MFRGGEDGAAPLAGLTRRGQYFYGSTFGGGDRCDTSCGVIFRVAADGKYRVLYSFTFGSDGGCPAGPPTFDNAGNLYGTTLYAGAYDHGVIFKLAPKGALTVLYSFSGGEDGASSSGRLVRDQLGNLYGAAGGGNGGNCFTGCGLLFKLAPDGTYTVLHAFAGGRDGMYPSGDLLRTRSGKLFGTTAGGGGEGDCGGSSCGTVYELKADGSEIILHRFAGSEGGNPVAGLIADQNGNLYGAALGGGDFGNGVVFTLKK